MRRASSLPIARYCGMSPVLGEKYGAGRSAAMSTAFHALCSGKDPDVALAMLTPDEREEIANWHKPTEVVIDGGDEVLCYESADTERAIAITDDWIAIEQDSAGKWVIPGQLGALNLLVSGHWDMAWRIDVNGVPTCYVADIKRSAQTVGGVPPGDNLQVLAYGIMCAIWADVEQFAVGYWFAEEGRYWWSTMHDLSDISTSLKWEQIKLAATTPEEYRPGAHCKECWSRKHCPQWLLDPEGVRPELAAFDPAALTEPRAAEWLLKVKQARDTIAAVEDQIKASFPRGVSDGNGKVYRPVTTKGRESVQVKALREALGQDAEQYVKRGRDYDSWRWTKA